MKRCNREEAAVDDEEETDTVIFGTAKNNCNNKKAVATQHQFLLEVEVDGGGGGDGGIATVGGGIGNGEGFVKKNESERKEVKKKEDKKSLEDKSCSSYSSSDDKNKEEILEIKLQELLKRTNKILQDNYKPKINWKIDRRNHFCDVTLIVLNERYECNAIVLITNSDIFKAMLDKKWNSPKEIALEEDYFIHPHFSTFLDYFYGIEFNITSDNIIPLILLSHKYSVTNLLKDMVSILIPLISIETVNPLYYLSQKYDLNELSTHIFKFASRNFQSLNFNLSLWDDNFLETLFKRNDLVVRNELAVFQQLKNLFLSGLNESTFQKLLKSIRFENISPIDLTLHVVRSKIYEHLNHDILKVIHNSIFCHFLSLPQEMKSRIYLEYINITWTITVEPDDSEVDKIKLFDSVEIHFSIVDDKIGLYLRLLEFKYPYEVCLGILNRKDFTVKSNKYRRNNKDDDAIGFTNFMNTSLLFDPYHGYWVEGCITVVATVSNDEKK